jgi:hypothetical protein
VHEAAEAGDAEATAIFVRGARELVACVVAVQRSLGAPADAALPVSHSGGVFDNAPAMVVAFRDGLAAAPVRLAYAAPRFTPAVGAALYAARLAGAPLPVPALVALQRNCRQTGDSR